MLDIFFVKVAYADGVDNFLHQVNDLILDPVLKLLFTVAFIIFFYGVMQYVMNPGNQDKIKQGKSHMLWGLLGLVIMFAVWGILQIIIDTFNLGGEINPKEGTVELNDYTPKYPPQ
ncbi:MAG: hypothetical protein KGZ39_08690 [Simkania sp.]|nr:hypothetical protein [Simkania sp.]MBS3905385.1 hypothetical protein [Simkania sp.]